MLKGIETQGPCQDVMVRGEIKKTVFFMFSRKGGGDLVESKISLTEKTEIFLDFFAERGGGSHPIQKGFSRKLGKISKKSHFFWIFCRKLGFFWTFFRNGGGGSGSIQNFP